MAAEEFKCPVSNECALNRRCFSAEQIRASATQAYSRTRRQAQDSIGKNEGPFIKISSWYKIRAKEKRNARSQGCAQPDFFDKDIDQLTEEKKYRGELA